MCKQIFSRVIEDSKITHEELLEVFEVKNQYENSKEALKRNDKKELEYLIGNGFIPLRDNSKLSKDSVKSKLDGLMDLVKKSGVNKANAFSDAGTQNSYIYPSLTSFSAV